MQTRLIYAAVLLALGLGRVNAQSLPPPAVGGRVEIEVVSGTESQSRQDDYLPAKPYTILAETIGRSVSPRMLQTFTPGASGSVTSTFTFDDGYAAEHPEVEKPIRGVGFSLRGSEFRYREIVVKTDWDSNGQPTFELTAAAKNGPETYRIEGKGEGRILDNFILGGPAAVPRPKFHVGDVTEVEGKVPWFAWSDILRYRHLPGINNFWASLQPDGSVAVFHDQYYNLVAPTLGEFQPIGAIVSSGTPGYRPRFGLTVEPLTAGGAYSKLREANWTFSDNFQPTTDAGAHYAFSPEGASASKLRYKLQIQPGLERTITWMETFTPEGASEPTDRRFLSETVTADAAATQVYTVDPFTRAGNQPGRYRVVAFESDSFDATLTADTNGDNKLLPAGGPITGHVIANADTVSATQPYRLLANDDDSKGDAADDHVNGAGDLANFYPVFLNIKSLLAALPPGVVYKLSQADGALNFVYTDLKQSNAFSFRDDARTEGYGPDFDRSAAEALVLPITRDGVSLSETFLDRIRHQDQGVILIEARFGSTAPLVLAAETGTGTAIVSLPLQAFSVGLYVDANRDSEIKTDGSDATSAARPYWFWVNDDDDSGDVGGSDIPQTSSSSGVTRNCDDFHINGTRDLVDWFPVFLDIKPLIQRYAPSFAPGDGGVHYRLKQADGALNMVFTRLTRADALKYQTQDMGAVFGGGIPLGLNSSLTEARLFQVTPTGIDLFGQLRDLYAMIIDQGGAVLLVEGNAPTLEPLVLAVEKADGTLLAELKLEIKISPVEQMFRHLNLRNGADAPQGNGADGLPLLIGEVGDDHSALPTSMNEPGAFPDEPGESRWMFFIHGYNVSGRKARGWNAETFKRCYWSGSKSRFVGVTWFGNPGTGSANIVQGYHWAVRNAVPTAQALANQVNPLSGSKSVVGHSQGCWVAAVAAADFGLNVGNLCLIDAAFARECFDGEGATDVTNMVPTFWQDYPAWSWSANWHQAFASGDARSALTWRARLVPALGRTVVHNFYSSTEDVLEKFPGTPTLAVVQNAFRAVANLDAAELGRYAWICQEKTKGDKALFTQGSGYGGWGFNLHDGLLSAHPKWYVPDLSQPVRRPKTPEEIGPATTALSDGLRHNPVFRIGWGYYDTQNPAREIVETSPTYNTGPEWILDLYQAATGSPTASAYRTQLLAEAVPALSLPVGANATTALGEDNFNMPELYANPDRWPNERGVDSVSGRPFWHHSDIREVAYPYIHELFHKITKLSERTP